MITSRHLLGAKAIGLAALLGLLAAGPAGAGTATSSVASPRDPAIILPINGDITLYVDSKDAGDALAFGLSSPYHRVMCGKCVAGMKRDFGNFDVGTTLVFFLRDRTHGQTYQSTDTTHARIEEVSPQKWTIHWDDGGGDGDYNDLVTSIVLSPPES